MADRIELAFRDAADRLLPAGETVLAAVSGGGDSVALLHLLVRRGARDGPDVAVAHLDHGLRRGSVADRRFVERLASEFGLRCVADRRPVHELRRASESPEEAARRVRRRFLLETADRVGAASIATGHTLDDQAETVLMRLLRGAGPSALAGIAERGPGPFVRPLLGIGRADLRRFLARHRFPFRDDPSNRNLRFDRNRLRLLILPILEEHANPKAARHLVQAADLLREDAALLDGLAEERFRECSTRTAAGWIVLEASRLSEVPPALARRIARVALHAAGIAPKRVSARHVAALLDLAHGSTGRRLDLPGGSTAARKGTDVILTPTDRI